MLAFFKPYTFQKSKVGTFHQERNPFSQEHHAFFGQLASLASTVVDYHPRWSKKLKMAC